MTVLSSGERKSSSHGLIDGIRTKFPFPNGVGWACSHGDNAELDDSSAVELSVAVEVSSEVEVSSADVVSLSIEVSVAVTDSTVVEISSASEVVEVSKPVVDSEVELLLSELETVVDISSASEVVEVSNPVVDSEAELLVSELEASVTNEVVISASERDVEMLVERVEITPKDAVSLRVKYHIHLLSKLLFYTFSGTS